MYVALKPCRFQGHRFKVGELIEESLVTPSAIRRLTLSGRIAVAGGDSPAVATLDKTKLSVPIIAQEGITNVEMTEEELLRVVATIQMSQEEILQEIATFESTDQLLLLSVLNGTDEVYEATKARAEELMPAEDHDEEEHAVYSKRKLERMERADLVEYAESLGIEVTEEMSKKKIAELCIEKQGE